MCALTLRRPSLRYNTADKVPHKARLPNARFLLSAAFLLLGAPSEDGDGDPGEYVPATSIVLF